MADTHNRIEQLELGANRSHEVIVEMDRKVESSMEGLEWRLEGSKMRVRGPGSLDAIVYGKVWALEQGKFISWISSYRENKTNSTRE